MNCEGMTHAELVERAGRWLRGTRKCCVVLTEPVAFSCREIPDAIGFEPRGWAVVVEVKIGRADFLGDRYKISRRLETSTEGRYGLGNERWYLTTPGVINDEDDLRGWGHLELRGSRVFKKREPVSVHEVVRPEVPLLVAVLRRHLWQLENQP